MIEFNKVSNESYFIKNLLYSTFLPLLRTVRENDYIIRDRLYIYKCNIILCTDSGYIPVKNANIDVTEYPEKLLRKTDDERIKVGQIYYSIINGRIQKIVGTKGDLRIPIAEGWYEENIASYDVLGEYYFGERNDKFCRNFLSSSEGYDYKTHEKLGQYLRNLRDMYGLNLMPLYNCFSNQLLKNIHITNTKVERTSQDFATKVYKVPIRFNTDYTICMENVGMTTFAPAFIHHGTLLNLNNNRFGNNVDATNKYIKLNHNDVIHNCPHLRFKNPIKLRFDNVPINKVINYSKYAYTEIPAQYDPKYYRLNQSAEIGYIRKYVDNAYITIDYNNPLLKGDKEYQPGYQFIIDDQSSYGYTPDDSLHPNDDLILPTPDYELYEGVNPTIGTFEEVSKSYKKCPEDETFFNKNIFNNNKTKYYTKDNTIIITGDPITDSGNIASFNVDTQELCTSLKVDMEPHQAGTPWMATTNDTRPYLFRQTGDGQIGHSANSAYDTLIGCSYVWNQLARNGNFADGTNYWSSGGTLSASNGVLSMDANTDNYVQVFIASSVRPQSVIGHKYLFGLNVNAGSNNCNLLPTGSAGDGNVRLASSTDTRNELIWNCAVSKPMSFTIRVYSTTSGVAEDVHLDMHDVILIDLTAFATEVADYAYTLEQSEAGSGIAWLKANYPKMFVYNAYSLPTIVNTLPTKKITRGFNQWDEETELGSIDSSTGANSPANDRLRSKNYISVISGTTYYSNLATRYYFYDANKAYMGLSASILLNSAGTFTVPSGARFMRFGFPSAYGTTYNNDITINIHWDGERDGEYEQYVEHEYDLGSVTLRGYPKVENGQIVCYGDVRGADGECERVFAELTNQSGSVGDTITLTGIKTTNPYFLCTAGLLSEVGTLSGTTLTLTKALSGDTIVYELATPTTETVATFASPQIVDDWGTEEYVDTRTTPIPVGHRTRYADIYDISGTSSVDVFVRGVNQWDEEWELGVWDASNGQAVASTTRIRSKNAVQVIPDATYYVSVNGFSGTFYMVWYDANDNFVGSDITHTANRTFTIPSNACYLRFFLQGTYGTTYNHDISINYPATDTSYHAYQGADYTQALGRTVYGGNLDLVSGVLRITHGSFLIGDKTVSYSSSGDCFAIAQEQSASYIGDALMSDVFEYKGYNTAIAQMLNAQDNTIWKRYNNGLGTNATHVYFKCTRYGSDIDAFKSDFADSRVIYELAEPIEVQLTPHQINTVVGQNHVFANLGDVEITHVPWLSSTKYVQCTAASIYDPDEIYYYVDKEKSEGWYEFVDGDFVPTEDTYIKADKTYYKKEMTEVPVTYNYDITEDNCCMYDYIEDELYLLIQVPSVLKSNIIILEGDYTDIAEQKYYDENRFELFSNSRLDYLFTDNLILMETNTNKIRPFSPTLIQFLLWNAICNLDSINNDMDRLYMALEVVSSWGADPKYNHNYWYNKYREIIFNYSKEFPKKYIRDNLGYVTKDIERIIYQGEDLIDSLLEYPDDPFIEEE